MSGSSGITGLEEAWESFHLQEEEDRGMDVAPEGVGRSKMDGQDMR